MAEPTRPSDPASHADVYLDPDAARSLAVGAQDAVKTCGTNTHEALERRPELGGAEDEASVAVKEALSALLAGSRARESSAAEKAGETITATFRGVDLTTGTDIGSGDELGKVMR